MPKFTLFHTICADPPWQFGDKLPGDSRGAVKNYRVLSVEQIARFLDDGANGFERDPETGLTIPLRHHLAPDCRLFLWRVASMQQEALDVMRAWGFTLKSEVAWRKLTVNGKPHFGMGRQVRMGHEIALIGVLGKPGVLDRSVRSVLDAEDITPFSFEAGYAGHSVKPEAFYSLVEQLSPGPYLELFGRRRRDRWTVLGDEVPEVVVRRGIV